MAPVTSAILVGPAAFKDTSSPRAPTHHSRPLTRKKSSTTARSTPGPCRTTTRDQRLYRGYWVMEGWVLGMLRIQQKGFTARRGDVVLASSPKCGTTWLKALSFAIMARDAHPPAAADHPLIRHTPHDCVPFMEPIAAAGWLSKLDELPSPRLLGTHMPYSILPASITKNPDCKIVYICRDAKDMVVSTWHFMKHLRPQLSFSDMFEFTCEGKSLCGPFWDHVLGYWNARSTMVDKEEGRPDAEMMLAPVLFLRYEEILQHPASNVRKLARFLGQPFFAAEEEAKIVDDIVSLCSFDKLRNLEVNKTGPNVFALMPRESYFRKGCKGDWKNHITEEMALRFDAILQDKFHGSGLDLL